MPTAQIKQDSFHGVFLLHLQFQIALHPLSKEQHTPPPVLEILAGPLPAPEINFNRAPPHVFKYRDAIPKGQNLALSAKTSHENI